MRGFIFALLLVAGAIASTPALAALTVEEEAAAAEALAVRLRTALQPDRCLGTEEALAAIQTVTEGEDVQTIAAAIDLIETDPAWCETVRVAISIADEAAQLAMAQSGATGAVGGGSAPGTPFGAGGVGSPGGGGGSNYPD
jgi:hypothetical protein